MSDNGNQDKKSDPQIAKKSKEEGFVVTGTVSKAERGRFRVQIDDTGHEVMATIAGKLRKYTIKIVPGDKVQVEVSPYDLTKGRIIYREK